MFKVVLYGRVRRPVLVRGVSQRTAAREFGISRKSVRKMVTFSVPPGYQNQEPLKRPKLGPWVGVIDAILKREITAALERAPLTSYSEPSYRGFADCWR